MYDGEPPTQVSEPTALPPSLVIEQNLLVSLAQQVEALTIAGAATSLVMGQQLLEFLPSPLRCLWQPPIFKREIVPSMGYPSFVVPLSLRRLLLPSGTTFLPLVRYLVPILVESSGPRVRGTAIEKKSQDGKSIPNPSPSLYELFSQRSKEGSH